MKIEKEFKYGDILLTRSNSWLSKAIRWFMEKYRPGNPSFSHVAVVVNMWGEPWVAEAIASGVRLRSLPQSGHDVAKQVLILRHQRGFNGKQIEKMSKKVASLAGVRYQYENLPQWVVKIILKINIFKDENEKAIYCSELGAIAMNQAYPKMFAKPNATCPVDHLAHKDYDILDINNIL